MWFRNLQEKLEKNHDWRASFSVIFPPMIWIFMESEGDEIKSKQLILKKILRTLSEEQNIDSLWMKKYSTDKFRHLSFVHHQKEPFNCEVCDFSIALQNLTWKDMLNWFMKRWNNTHVKFVTTLQNRDRNEKKKPFKFEVSNLCYFYERNYVLFPHSATW